MATDPTRSIRHHEHETEIALDAHEVLDRLALLPPSLDAPYLTVSLDWRPAGGDPGRSPAQARRPSERRANRDDGPVSRRPARDRFEREAASLIAEQGPRGAALDSLNADVERVLAYLDGDLPASAQGVFIVACDAEDVFEEVALGVPVPTTVQIGPTPALSVLTRVVEDHPTYAVLMADQQEATLSFVTHATRGQSVSFAGSEWPRRQSTGGNAQRRLKNRVEEKVNAFARDIAGETRIAMDELGIDLLIVTGNEIMTSALDRAFHPSVKERLVGYQRLDLIASEQEMIDATMPSVEEAERQHEAAEVAALKEAVGAGGWGVSGAEEVLLAVKNGQVATLLLVDDFQAEGWADYALPAYGVGPVPSAHPLGGDLAALVPIALEEELIRLAFMAGAEVQIVHSTAPLSAADREGIPPVESERPRTEAAAALVELGGVGALLRFRTYAGAGMARTAYGGHQG